MMSGFFVVRGLKGSRSSKGSRGYVPGRHLSPTRRLFFVGYTVVNKALA